MSDSRIRPTYDRPYELVEVLDDYDLRHGITQACVRVEEDLTAKEPATVVSLTLRIRGQTVTVNGFATQDEAADYAVFALGVKQANLETRRSTIAPPTAAQTAVADLIPASAPTADLIDRMILAGDGRDLVIDIDDSSTSIRYAGRGITTKMPSASPHWGAKMLGMLLDIAGISALRDHLDKGQGLQGHFPTGTGAVRMQVIARNTGGHHISLRPLPAATT